jgi:hypothetical protein
MRTERSKLARLLDIYYFINRLGQLPRAGSGAEPDRFQPDAPFVAGHKVIVFAAVIGAHVLLIRSGHGLSPRY